MDKKKIEELLTIKNDSKKPMAKIVRTGEATFTINNHQYEVVKNYKDAFIFEEFVNRYHPALNQYDYIVGDWGYGQLRLRGFYDQNRPTAQELSIDQLQDYLIEVVNFGAAYFVIHNLEVRPMPRKTRNTNSRRNNRNRRRNNNGSRNPNNANRKNVKKRDNEVIKVKDHTNQHKFIIKETK